MGHFASSLSLSEGLGDGRTPVVESIGHRPGDLRAVGGKFDREVAEQAAFADSTTHVLLDDGLEIRADPLERRSVAGEDVGGAGLDDVCTDESAVRTHHLDAERFLALEVVVERTLRYACGIDDVLHAAAIEPARVEHLDRARDELIPNAGSCHQLTISNRSASCLTIA